MPNTPCHDPIETPIPDGLLACVAAAAEIALHAGQPAPAFRLHDVDGRSHALVELTAGKPLVISFYRGLWCDYCDVALGALASFDAAIRDLGATQVAIGPLPRNEAEQSRIGMFPMPVLIDKDLHVASAYGLTIVLPDELHGTYAALGYAPPEQTTAWRIGIPATYVVDRGGTVVLAAIDIDYRNRLDPPQILSALRGLRDRTLR